MSSLGFEHGIRSHIDGRQQEHRILGCDYCGAPKLDWEELMQDARVIAAIQEYLVKNPAYDLNSSQG
jgi:hypothetical protein